jgi:hypothetical protein
MERRPLCGCEYGVEVELRSCLVTVRSWQQRTAARRDRFGGGGPQGNGNLFSSRTKCTNILAYPMVSEVISVFYQDISIGTGADASEYARRYVDISS